MQAIFPEFLKCVHSIADILPPSYISIHPSPWRKHLQTYLLCCWLVIFQVSPQPVPHANTGFQNSHKKQSTNTYTANPLRRKSRCSGAVIVAVFASWDVIVRIRTTAGLPISMAEFSNRCTVTQFQFIWLNWYQLNERIPCATKLL